MSFGTSSSHSIAQYGGAPGQECASFLRLCVSALSQHALQTGGHVQVAAMSNMLKASVTAASGLVKPMEDFMLIIGPTYLADARTGTFNRDRLRRLPPEVSSALHQQYRGPPKTMEELGVDILARVGATQGVTQLSRYRAGRSNQPPVPIAAAPVDSVTSARATARLQNLQRRCFEAEAAVDELQHRHEQAQQAARRTLAKLSACTREIKACVQLGQAEQLLLLEAFQQQLFPDGAPAPAVADVFGAPQQPAAHVAADAPPAPPDAPPVPAPSEESEEAAAPAAADGSDSDSDLEDGLHRRAPATAAQDEGAAEGLLAEWRRFITSPNCFRNLEAIVADLCTPGDPDDSTLRIFFPSMPPFQGTGLLDLTAALQVAYRGVLFSQREYEGHLQRQRKLRRQLVEREELEGRMRVRLAEQREQLCRLHQAESSVHSTQGEAGLTSPAAQAAVFEAYVHPRHPELLVTPGTLVVLLLLELVRLRCAYLPGANSLRTNPPVQQYGKHSLVQYGQLFQEAAEMRGQDDTPAMHIQWYLQGLADPALRSRYKEQQLNADRAPTTLQATIAAVERLATKELAQLGAEAEVGDQTARQRFLDKQMFVNPSAVPSSVSQSRGPGEVSYALVSALWPAAKGREQEMLDSLCPIHAQGTGKPHKLSDCTLAKKWSADVVKAKQTFMEWQANRVSQHLAASAVSWVDDSAELPSTFVPQVAAAHGLDEPWAAAASAPAEHPAVPPPDNPDAMIVQYTALSTLTGGANGLAPAVAAVALGGGSQQYTRAPAVRQAYEAACKSAPVPTGPLPSPAPEAPCPHCGRAQGHGQGICFAYHPDCSPEFFKGPLISDGPQAEKVFLQRVRECRPHSRYQQAAAQGLVIVRPPRGHLRPTPAAGRPPFRPAANLRAAAAAAREEDAVDDDYIPEEEYQAAWGGDRNPMGGCVGVVLGAAAASPVGFNVLDHASHMQQTQPAPGPTRLPIDHTAVSTQVQQALDQGDTSQQLYAVSQGVQVIVGALQQLSTEVQQNRTQMQTLEQLVSSKWHLPVPVPVSQPSPAAPTASQERPDPPAVTDAAAVAASRAAEEPVGEQPALPGLAAPEEGSSPVCHPPVPPPHPAGEEAWAHLQLDLALGTRGGSYIMDRPRHKDPGHGLVVVEPDHGTSSDLHTRFDTGCTVQLLAAAAARRARIRFFRLPRPLQITLADGRTSPVLGITVTFKVVLRPGHPRHCRTTFVRALVLPDPPAGAPGLGYDLLLGKGWMAEHNIDVLPSRQRLQYPSDSKEPSYLALITRCPAPSAPEALSITTGDLGAQVAVAECVCVEQPAIGESAQLTAQALHAPARSAANVFTAQVTAPAGLAEPSSNAEPADLLPYTHSVITAHEINVVTTQMAAPAGLAELPTGTVPTDLLPHTRRALGTNSDARERPYYPGEFNPLQDLTPEGELSDAESEHGDASLLVDDEFGWHYGHGLNPEQQDQLRQVLTRNIDAFAREPSDLVGYKGSDGKFEGVHIPLKEGVERVYEPPRRYGQQHRDIQDEKCQELLRLGFIVEVPTTTPFASNSTCPGKKDADGNWTERRFCIDFRPLNAVTVRDHYRMPLPEDLFNSLGSPAYLSKLDLRSGFHQLPVHPDDIAKTAFWWGPYLYAYTRMPFGLCNATAVFQRVVDDELTKAGLTHCAKVFVDDVLIHSDTFEDHLGHLEAVLQCLARAGLRVHPKKSTFRH